MRTLKGSWWKTRDGGFGARVYSDNKPEKGQIVAVTNKAKTKTVDRVIASVVWSGEDRDTGLPIHLCTLEEEQPRSQESRRPAEAPGWGDDDIPFDVAPRSEWAWG